ncbi:hypothetical protein BJX63DRAFT_429241 [Aspergillus granulosus]|uniref:Uncharacterized protein n=1 Tax=Aspergillus granulosus TaxID=176169 RepID=A0ABR4HUD4_9EURO
MSLDFLPLGTVVRYILSSLGTILERILISIVSFQHRLNSFVAPNMPFDSFLSPRTPSVALDTAGLVALADLSTIQERTALTGTASLSDIFILAPGLHMQQRAPDLSAGESPACGALTTGYVFRVENPATVYYLQRVGRTGQLTTLSVTRLRTRGVRNWLFTVIFPAQNMNLIAGLAYSTAILWGLAVFLLFLLTGDWWGLALTGVLMAARLINIVIVQRRSHLTWSGAPEPGVEGDLLILLTQDRWIRMKGLVDDLKAVTSGQWLRDKTTVESWLTAIATVAVYLAAALASNISQFGKILLLCLFIGSSGLLALVNAATDRFHMHDCLVQLDGERKSYPRRLHLAEELIRETGRDDWAVRMGMVVKNNPVTETERAGEVIM